MPRKVVTISELQMMIHTQRRIEEEAGWIAFDAWVNRRITALMLRFPDQRVQSLPMQILFEEGEADE